MISPVEAQALKLASASRILDVAGIELKIEKTAESMNLSITIPFETITNTGTKVETACGAFLMLGHRFSLNKKSKKITIYF